MNNSFDVAAISDILTGLNRSSDTLLNSLAILELQLNKMKDSADKFLTYEGAKNSDIPDSYTDVLQYMTGDIGKYNRYKFFYIFHVTGSDNIISLCERASACIATIKVGILNLKSSVNDSESLLDSMITILNQISSELEGKPNYDVFSSAFSTIAGSIFYSASDATNGVNCIPSDKILTDYWIDKPLYFENESNGSILVTQYGDDGKMYAMGHIPSSALSGYYNSLSKGVSAAEDKGLFKGISRLFGTGVGVLGSAVVGFGNKVTDFMENPSNISNKVTDFMQNKLNISKIESMVPNEENHYANRKITYSDGSVTYFCDSSKSDGRIKEMHQQGTEIIEFDASKRSDGRVRQIRDNDGSLIIEYDSSKSVDGRIKKIQDKNENFTIEFDSSRSDGGRTKQVIDNSGRVTIEYDSSKSIGGCNKVIRTKDGSFIIEYDSSKSVDGRIKEIHNKDGKNVTILYENGKVSNYREANQLENIISDNNISDDNVDFNSNASSIENTSMESSISSSNTSAIKNMKTVDDYSPEAYREGFNYLGSQKNGSHSVKFDSLSKEAQQFVEDYNNGLISPVTPDHSMELLVKNREDIVVPKGSYLYIDGKQQYNSDGYVLHYDDGKYYKVNSDGKYVGNGGHSLYDISNAEIHSANGNSVGSSAVINNSVNSSVVLPSSSDVSVDNGIIFEEFDSGGNKGVTYTSYDSDVNPDGYIKSWTYADGSINAITTDGRVSLDKDGNPTTWNDNIRNYENSIQNSSKK